SSSSRRPRSPPMNARASCATSRCSRTSTARSSTSCRAPAPSAAACRTATRSARSRSEEHTSELQSREKPVCRLLLEKKKPSEPRDRVARAGQLFTLCLQRGPGVGGGSYPFQFCGLSGEGGREWQRAGEGEKR